MPSPPPVEPLPQPAAARSAVARETTPPPAPTFPHVPPAQPAGSAREAGAAPAAPPWQRQPAPRPVPPGPARQGLAGALAKLGVGEADWETLVGGKWLNKIGIVVLVIGIARVLEGRKSVRMSQVS